MQYHVPVGYPVTVPVPGYVYFCVPGTKYGYKCGEIFTGEVVHGGPSAVSKCLSIPWLVRHARLLASFFFPTLLLPFLLHLLSAPSREGPAPIGKWRLCEDIKPHWLFMMQEHTFWTAAWVGGEIPPRESCSISITHYTPRSLP